AIHHHFCASHRIASSTRATPSVYGYVIVMSNAILRPRHWNTRIRAHGAAKANNPSRRRTEDRNAATRRPRRFPLMPAGTGYADHRNDCVAPSHPTRKPTELHMDVTQGTRVYDIGTPDRIGIIVVKGEQVSEIRFSDGCTRHISNEQ